MLIHQCCLCNTVTSISYEPEFAGEMAVSHGMCNECQKIEMEKIEVNRSSGRAMQAIIATETM